MSAVQFAKPLVASALCVASLFAQSTSNPSVEINYPGLNANRYINITVDGFSEHGLTVNDQGVPSEMVGFPLVQFMETAGWGKTPKDEVSQYLVRIEGDSTAILALSEVLRRSLDYRVWLVTGQCGTPLCITVAPSVLAVGSDGVVTARVKHVRRIRVTNVTSQELIDDAEFGRLSGYERDEGYRTLWWEYVRVEGIPVMIVTCSKEGRPEKSAVLLSEQVSEWNDGRLLDFLAGSVALRIDQQAKINRVGDFTVVGLRFAL
jgi:hypothetical protein